VINIFSIFHEKPKINCRKIKPQKKIIENEFSLVTNFTHFVWPKLIRKNTFKEIKINRVAVDGAMGRSGTNTVVKILSPVSHPTNPAEAIMTTIKSKKFFPSRNFPKRAL
jgi:hypothetical protein